MLVVETRVFTARVVRPLSDDEYRALQWDLVRRPEARSLIPGSGGLRKVRWTMEGRGKRGGARVIYFWHARSATLLMLLAYAKNERDDLSPAERHALRRLIETEYP